MVTAYVEHCQIPFLITALSCLTSPVSVRMFIMFNFILSGLWHVAILLFSTCSFMLFKISSQSCWPLSFVIYSQFMFWGRSIGLPVSRISSHGLHKGPVFMTCHMQCPSRGASACTFYWAFLILCVWLNLDSSSLTRDPNLMLLSGNKMRGSWRVPLIGFETEFKNWILNTPPTFRMHL